MKEQILKLDVKKHVKIYKLHQLGLSRREIAELLNTNQGHVGNALRDYQNNPNKVELANKISYE